MKTNQQKQFSSPVLLIGVALIGLLSWIFTIFLITTKMSWEREMTPIATQREGWRVYQFDAKKKFSFEYPANGKIKIENKFDDIPTITMSAVKDGKEYAIIINAWHAKEYRGEFVTAKEEKRQYGNQLVTIKTIYFKNKPIEIVAIFESFASPRDAIQTISMDLSGNDTSYALRIFNHLLSSLKYE